MDEEKLKNILQNQDVPAANENAKKIAINMALAEFEKNQKTSQGSSWWARRMGTSTNKRRDPMEQKSKKQLYYGSAMLVASLCLFALPTALQQTKQNEMLATADVQSMPAPQDEAMMTVITEESKASGPAQVEMLQMEGGAVANAVPASPPAVMAKMDMKSIGGVQRSAAPVEPMLMKPQAYFAGDAEMAPQPVYKDVGRDKFEDFDINPVKIVAQEPVSTFSADVDTASYSFVRGQLNDGVLPQKDSVRVEEMINYFDYHYPLPETREQPFKPTIAVTDSPWAKGKKLVHIGIKGFDVEQKQKPKTNLVFLLDVSGSMEAPDKLPLLKNSLKMLLDTLQPEDTIAIAVYAGAAGTVLEPTKASDKAKIIAALDQLSAGGSTAGAEGINLAYQLAESNFNKDAVNRVILATDGDFNVGITSEDELKDFVERKREKGIFLSVLGFGQGNYNDQMMQALAQNGNGTAAYIDNLNEARKVLVEEASSTLFPIAKDVKLQVEFNAARVSEYRLIGYETRALNREDFNNDKVDAGDIGAGHAVTAIYEITPVGSQATASVDELRYSPSASVKPAGDASGEYGFLKIRYKLPDGQESNLISAPIVDGPVPTGELANDLKWSTAVAGFGQILQGGKYTGSFSYDDVVTLANSAKGTDEYGYRAEFIQLVRLAKSASPM